MAQKTSLQDYQQQIAQRLRDAGQAATASTHMSVLSGEQWWLVDLYDAAEVIALPQVTAVQLTRPWFLGLANVRGTLVGVVDFAQLRGEAPTPLTAETRLLVLSNRHRVNAGLLVARTGGLMNVTRMLRAAVPGAAWAGAAYEDRDGRVWWELDAGALVSDPRFLQISAL
jgi:twitching motility protein PilI